MARGGQAKSRSEPERRCIVTGRSGPRAGLIRFVVGPDGDIVPDVLGKLPGRGIWVSADRDALGTAAKKNLFSRSARVQVRVADDLVGRVDAALLQRVTELVSMARKAGRAVAGFEKVKGWLVSGEARVLLQAADGSPREKSRLRPPPGNDTYFGILTASELGLSFGRENVIHAALAAGGLTDRVVEETLRLSGVRGIDGGWAAGKAKKTV